MKALWKLLRGNRMAMIGVTILGLVFSARGRRTTSYLS